MDTRLDEGRKWARKCTLAIKCEVLPRNARVKVKICNDWYNAPGFSCGRQRYDANLSHAEEEILENIREPMEGINSTFDRIDEKLDRICDRLDGILDGLDRLLERVNEKFGQVHYRLDWIGGRLSGSCYKLYPILMLDEEPVTRQTGSGWN